MKIGGLRVLSIYSAIFGLISFTPPSFIPPFEPSEARVAEALMSTLSGPFQMVGPGT